ncbi:FAD dependent oxidoreductase [Metarhizium album ARSEF 1941]|uniref:FAD dependent oxidoreductase n=1 Tax=Metarhizium album (strain ARSEF 1941) TaxID=1081103 RepID=A0A0B2WNN1_METAS|nr:FAD dependent oxidoreductase [Metarhizium album ARSEF 1941]KHN95593.1 FAD dependent oxidoreductase [Metarhizium album ARSEF 1941]
MANNAPASSAISPNMPLPTASLSYWQRTTRAFKYLNHNQRNTPPISATYVIIGSGLTGALVAYNLVARGVQAEEILMLEAREAVSGSTGRNAGHIRPDAFRNFSTYQALHGSEQALNIVATEEKNLKLLAAFIRDNQIQCDFNLTTTFDVCLGLDAVEDEEKNIKDYLDAGGNLASLDVKCWYGAAAEERSSCPGAAAAYEWPAASVHPMKLVHWILHHVIEQGVQLWTHCLVEKIRQDGAGLHVQTSRGVVSAEKVVHCTNAYAGGVLSQLTTERLAPFAVQVASVIPPSVASGHKSFRSTMALRESARMFYGFCQKPVDGTVVVSVGRPVGKGVQAEESQTPEVAEEIMQRLSKLFGTTHEPERSGEGLDATWTGLISFTPDKVPYVGDMAELPGQYICAGFNGHGMANIFTCASGIVGLLLGRPWETTQLPDCYRYSQARLNKTAK